MAQSVKNLPVMQETQIPSLGWEDPLEKGMATLSSILAWRIAWTEEPGAHHPWGRKESQEGCDQSRGADVSTNDFSAS